MKASFRNKIPLIFLLLISVFWGFYYQSSNALNDYGEAHFEFLFLLDALFVLPVLCFLCISNKQEALTKAVLLVCLAVLIGSYIIPESSKHLMFYLQDARYAFIAVFLIVELTIILSIMFTIKAAFDNNTDPDVAIEKPIKKRLGDGLVSDLLCFEARMWTFALFARKIEMDDYAGVEHFSYHNKDGAKSNLLGFIIVTLVEIPIVHTLLYFIWSPLAANIVTALSIFTLLLFFAEYRACSRRPISIQSNEIRIRYGLFKALSIPFDNILDVEINDKQINRNRSLKRYNYFGVPNIKISLHKPISHFNAVYVGMDKPHKFIQQVAARLQNEDL